MTKIDPNVISIFSFKLRHSSDLWKHSNLNLHIVDNFFPP